MERAPDSGYYQRAATRTMPLHPGTEPFRASFNGALRSRHEHTFIFQAKTPAQVSRRPRAVGGGDEVLARTQRLRTRKQSYLSALWDTTHQSTQKEVSSSGVPSSAHVFFPAPFRAIIGSFPTAPVGGIGGLEHPCNLGRRGAPREKRREAAVGPRSRPFILSQVSCSRH